MKNWRKTLADILRDLGGKAHLSEIYSEIETRGSELGTEWKAVARGNLERNSSDCDAWDKKYDIFELKQKGSGNWFLKTNIFREQILDPNTNFFIFTTGKKEHRDDDFKVRLSERIKEDKSLFEELKKYEGQKIFLPINKNFRPKKEYLKIHRERK